VLPEERAAVPDLARIVSAAVDAHQSLGRREDLRGLLAAGVVHHEVPFSLHVVESAPRGTVVRGRIDCLVERPDGAVVVLEFKTGERRIEHARQLETYVTAARAIFPGRGVEGTLVYV